MMVAPPMAQVVHTMLAQVLFVPPSLSASSREPSASVASTATVMAVPSNGEGGGDTSPEQSLRQRKDENEDRASAWPDADREYDRHHFAPGEHHVSQNMGDGRERPAGGQQSQRPPEQASVRIAAFVRPAATSWLPRIWVPLKEDWGLGGGVKDARRHEPTGWEAALTLVPIP